MAESMREIRRRIRSVETTEHITSAMHLVSASKFRRSKSRYDQIHRQLARVTEIMESLMAELAAAEAEQGRDDDGGGGRRGQATAGKKSGSKATAEVSNAPQENEDASAARAIPENEAASAAGACPELPVTAVILITSNRGLCGSYNTSLIRIFEGLRVKLPQCQVFAIGSRGLDYIHHQNIPALGECLDAPERITSEKIRDICGQLLKEYEKTPGGQILLVSMKYVNTLHQEPAVRRLMPPQLPQMVQTPETPEKDGGRETGGDGTDAALWPEAPWREYVPSAKQIQEYLIPKYLELTLYKAVCEAAVCEHAARRTAMESASENGKEMLSSLSLTYNRARQQTITDELIEIVSGSEALKKGV